MEEYLSKLNDQQREAVVYCDGPQLVIAGAGSGKTRVLTYKIVHLLAHGYEPWRIMALTFTNKAASEMRERIQGLVGAGTAGKLWMGTFHSIFLKILHIHAEKIGFKPNFTIYDTPDTKSLIKAIIKDMDLDDKVYKVSTVMNMISSAKNALIGPAEYANDPEIREADRAARRYRMYEVYASYVNRCHVAGAMDFDDILYHTFRLFEDHPDVLHHYQEFFRYVLVDEYQDTNYAQHAIISQLCSGTHNLCVVGDDAQSIYSFRGANIANILNLKNAYADLQIYKLEQNYRSTQNIINAANALIDKNKEQIRKQVFSRNDKGDKIEVVKCYSDYEEAHLLANSISKRQMQTGDPFDEFAVLYRTNAQSRAIEEALRRRNIPYRIYGGMSFYQRKEVKDAIAYFRLSVNPSDDEALKRIINYPARGIGETTLKKLTRAAIDNEVSIWDVVNDIDRYSVDINKGTRNKLTAFAEMIHRFINMNDEGKDALELARQIISDTGLLTVLISDRTPESISKQENLQELINGVQEFVATRFEEGNDEDVFMTNFLSDVSLSTDQDENDGVTTPRVTLMTIHASKGLEFGNVFIVGVEEELLPSLMSMDSAKGVEEERRLLYVAITRAKRFCMMSYAQSRFRNGQTVFTRPSRFLKDIDGKFMQFMLGSDMTDDRDSSGGSSRFRDSYHTQATSGMPKIRKEASADTKNKAFSPQRISSTPVSAQAGDFRIHSLSELSEGMVIEHLTYGRGTIVDIDTSMADARIRVKFDNVDIKTIMIKYAKLKIPE